MWPVTSAAIIFAVAFAASAREIPKNVDTKIVGGYDAPDGKYPYTVSLRVYFVHFCGGSIINDEWVLTSARCLARKRADEISVISGTNHLSESGQMYQAILIVSHPYFDDAKHINDVGLIRVSRRIIFTDKIQPIPLPVKDFNKVDYPAVLSGWGSTEIGGGLPELLQEIELRVISQELCMELQELVIHSHICTLMEPGEGACYGDSGSPLVADGTQIGIVSFGNPCARGRPDVYTRVWTFTHWINVTIQTNSKDRH